MTVGSAWAELDAELPGRGVAVKRVHPDSTHDLHIALDLQTRRRQLIYERRWRPADVLPDLPATQAITCRGTLEQGGRRMTVVVELADPALADVFTPLVEDLAGRIAAAPDERRATDELATGLARWKELFDELARDGMSELARRGLAGELLVLLSDVLPHVAPSPALAAWTGPHKRNQDFQRPAVALEVKVTTGQQPQGFVVANERELDPTGTGTLVVVHLSLDERRGGAGGSINDLVDAARQRLVGHPLAQQSLAEKLARVGYLEPHRDMYAEPHYEIRAVTYMHVRDDFPRITENDVRKGVGAIRYTVSLSACQGYELDAADVHALLERGAG